MFSFQAGTTFYRESIQVGKKTNSRDHFKFVMQNIPNYLKAEKSAKLKPFIYALNKTFIAYAPIEGAHSIDESVIPCYGLNGLNIRGKPIQ